jgi:hypothetical protein
MAITPTGQPAWSREVAHTDYGGNVNKVNYLSRGKIDALTDVGAADLCRLAADLEAVVRTAPFAVISYTCNDNVVMGVAPPTIRSAFMMTGVRTTSYQGGAAPSGFPSSARNGDGNVTFTFAGSYSDPYGVAHAFVPTFVQASVYGSSAAVATYTNPGDGTVQVQAWATDGTALAGAVCSLAVW